MLDFSDVLLLESSNTAAQEEMKKLTILIQQEKAKVGCNIYQVFRRIAEAHVQKAKSPASLVQASLEPATATVRRRVPIKIIDSSGKVLPTSVAAQPSPSGISDSPSASPTALGVKRSSLLETVSSRSLTTSGSAAISTPDLPARTVSSPKPNSFSEAKAARQGARPSRVGGGIFRASGERTIFATNGVDSRTGLRDNGEVQQPPSRFPLSQQSLDVLPETTYQTPSTLFDFNKLWRSLSSTEERWQYLTVSFLYFRTVLWTT